MPNKFQSALDNLTPPEDDNIEIDCPSCKGDGFNDFTREACRQCDGSGVAYVSEKEMKKKQKDEEKLERALAKEFDSEEEY